MNDRPRGKRPGPRRRSLSRRRAEERRVLWLGLLVSAVVHLIGLGFVGAWLEPDPTSVRRAEPMIVEPPRGMRVVEVAPADVPSMPEAPETPEPPDLERPAEEEPTPVAQAEPGRAVPADSVSAADRLAPRVVDPRLWAPMVLLPLPREPTLADVEARVAAALELLSDSALAAAEREIRARDWTVEDADGGRWGISPQAIHLGKLTLPLPIWIPLDVGADQEAQRWYQFDTAMERARILESFEERVRAIRERRDRERAERMAEENGGGG